MTQQESCRFCRIYATAVVGFAALLGGVLVLQFALLSNAKSFDHASVFLSESVVRMTATAASGSALLLALVLWSHPLSAQGLHGSLRRTLRRALLVSLPGYAVALVVSLSAGYLVAVGMGQSWAVFGPGLRVIGWRALGAGALGALLDAGLSVFLAWRYGERIHAGRISLPGKLILVLTVTVPLRATVGLVLSSLLSI